MMAASNIMGTSCVTHSATRFPVQTDDEILIATKEEVNME
jgi:hypothetical protein